MPKPRITFDRYSRGWRCQTIFMVPGELCFVTGKGATIKESYAQWKDLQIAYDKRVSSPK